MDIEFRNKSNNIHAVSSYLKLDYSRHVADVRHDFVDKHAAYHGLMSSTIIIDGIDKAQCLYKP